MDIFQGFQPFVWIAEAGLAFALIVLMILCIQEMRDAKRWERRK